MFGSQQTTAKKYMKSKTLHSQRKNGSLYRLVLHHNRYYINITRGNGQLSSFTYPNYQAAFYVYSGLVKSLRKKWGCRIGENIIQINDCAI